MKKCHLADRGFSTYALMALLWLRKVDSLLRLHHARRRDFRQSKCLGKNDRLLVWCKPCNWQKPRFIPKWLWHRLPQQLSVRMVRFTLAVPAYWTQSVTLISTLVVPAPHMQAGMCRHSPSDFAVGACGGTMCSGQQSHSSNRAR